ncbi:MAG TPA: dihydropteroate synthase [Terracidiphilus sp.]|nr:dihydropteroate synthase [Terracidiphilus sp.]
MTPSGRTISHWTLRTRSLDLGRRTLVMGVVNITQDSFSDGGRFLDPEAAVAQALTLLDDGADLLDLGAESTRPGSRAGNPTEAEVTAEEEQARLLPVIEGILKYRPDAILSADTYKSDTARAVLLAGAEIINDVSGFTWDGAMPHVCAKSGCGVVLMHTRGRPEEWRAQAKLPPDTLIETIRAGLSESLAIAARAGIVAEAVILDPGYGFGKKFDENYTMLARQEEFLALGCPLLAGLSRKSFLGHTLAPLFGGDAAPVESREIAGIAALVTAILHGASIVRVHDARPAVEAARIADAVLAGN